MQVRLLAADDPLELGDPRRGLDELVGAPRGGRAGVRGRRLGRRGERGRRRPPADLAAALAVKPGCPTRPIDLEPIVKQLARHPLSRATLATGAPRSSRATRSTLNCVEKTLGDASDMLSLSEAMSPF